MLLCLLMPTAMLKTPSPPLPPPRIGGLTRLLKELAVGESATVPRATADDIYKTGRVLGRVFTARRIDAERSRIWRTA
jgi:hypothetical protein